MDKPDVEFAWHPLPPSLAWAGTVPGIRVSSATEHSASPLWAALLTVYRWQSAAGCCAIIQPFKILLLAARLRCTQPFQHTLLLNLFRVYPRLPAAELKICFISVRDH